MREETLVNYQLLIMWKQEQKEYLKCQTTSKFPIYMKLYVSATHFNGGPGLHKLQSIFMQLVANMQFRAINFTSQVATSTKKQQQETLIGTK